MNLEEMFNKMLDENSLEEIVLGLSTGLIIIQLFEIEEIKKIIVNKIKLETNMSEKELNHILSGFVIQDSDIGDNDKVEILKDLGQI